MILGQFFRKNRQKLWVLLKKRVIWYYRTFHREEAEVEGIESLIEPKMRSAIHFWLRDLIIWVLNCLTTGMVAAVGLIPFIGFQPKLAFAGFGIWLFLNLAGQFASKVRGK